MSNPKARDPARWLIRRAARKAPPALAERLEEEWLADLATRSGTFERLRLGVGCCWATQVIAREFAAPKVLAGSTTTGNETMTAYATHDFSFFSRRSATFVAIIALHVVLAYVLMTGLARGIVRIVAPPMIGGLIDPLPTKPTPPPPANPHFDPPKIDLGQIQVVINDPPTDDGGTIQATGPGPIVDLLPPQTPLRGVNRVLGGPGKAFPATGDFYPASAIREGVTGAAIVRTCVDARGRLTSDPTLDQSSGSASLDGGALKLARAGSGHYRPTTEDGQPVSSCYPFRVTFTLHDK